MTDTIKNALSSMKSGWNKIDAKRRKLLIGVVLVVSMVALYLGFSGSGPDYALLFSNMELADAGAIVNDLESKNMKYLLEDNGKSILIEKNQVDNYRMDLAVNNMLPESSTGFEIFDDTGLMVTDEDRQIMYQRALTGELQRTINSLDGIISSKVHLVLPKKSIFETENRAATASVVIDIDPNYTIAESSIRGITALISGSVDNMPVENIQVISTNGLLLSDFLTEGSDQNLSSVLDQYNIARSSFQKEIETKLYSLLGSSYGFDNIKVSVLAELDFDSEESTVVTYYDPVVRSQEVKASGSNINEQQVTGGSIDDNISNVFEGEEGRESTYSNITNNELSSETTSYIRAPGQVQRLTTSVVYNGPLSENERSNIQSIVAAAIGYDGDRGDIVSVVAVDLPKDDEEIIDDVVEVEPENKLVVFFEENTVTVIIVSSVFLLLLIILVIVLVRRNKKKKAIEEERMIEEMERKIEEGMTIDKVFDDELDIDDIIMEPDMKIEKAKKYADKNPKLAADLIRVWMKE